VQWIETQDELFSKKGIQRLVEIGPGDTLSSMAKKTLISQQDRHDAATAAKRRLLYYKKDQKELRYESDPVEKPAKSEAIAPAALPSSSAPAVDSAPAATPVPVPAPAPVAAPTAASITDVPVTAKEIVVAIVASKLQKTFGSLATDQTIKQLSGGKVNSYGVDSSTN
jgi:fatty acid synthase subunit alpha